MPHEYITNEEDTELYGFKIKSGDVLTLRCYSTEGATNLFINACRADFGEQERPGETSDISTQMGQELIDAGAIYGRLVGGSWQNICGFDNALELGAVSAEGYVAFEIKIDYSVGICGFGLAARALPL